MRPLRTFAKAEHLPDVVGKMISGMTVARLVCILAETRNAARQRECGQDEKVSDIVQCILFYIFMFEALSFIHPESTGPTATPLRYRQYKLASAVSPLPERSRFTP